MYLCISMLLRKQQPIISHLLPLLAPLSESGGDRSADEHLSRTTNATITTTNATITNHHHHHRHQPCLSPFPGSTAPLIASWIFAYFTPPQKSICRPLWLLRIADNICRTFHCTSFVTRPPPGAALDFSDNSGRRPLRSGPTQPTSIWLPRWLNTLHPMPLDIKFAQFDS